MRVEGGDRRLQPLLEQRRPVGSPRRTAGDDAEVGAGGELGPLATMGRIIGPTRFITAVAVGGVALVSPAQQLGPGPHR